MIAGNDAWSSRLSHARLIRKLTRCWASLITAAGVWLRSNSRTGAFLTNNDHLYTTDFLTKATDGSVAWGAVRESFGRTKVANNARTEYLMRFPGQWEDSVGFNDDRQFQSSTGNYAPRGFCHRPWTLTHLLPVNENLARELAALPIAHCNPTSVAQSRVAHRRRILVFRRWPTTATRLRSCAGARLLATTPPH